MNWTTTTATTAASGRGRRVEGVVHNEGVLSGGSSDTGNVFGSAVGEGGWIEERGGGDVGGEGRKGKDWRTTIGPMEIKTFRLHLVRENLRGVV